ncbi:MULTISPECIES: IS66 family insertion sequence element accessory protein TnpA [Allobacillus]|uniref:Transposase n=1 Tax=Allobacillus salarius TaxID=1955272 RepID=A0A556P6C4_9BACI|nr:hypothetical protein [Allobacillus salarius]TSJ59943.1 hypothetical protein FPQ13_12850 [Allobacillus salarius]
MEESHNVITTSDDVEVYSKEWWIEKIQEWKESGLTVKEWCEQEQVCTYHQFINKRRNLCPEEVQTKEQSVSGWSAIEINTSASIEVECRDVRMTIEKGFDQELLQELLEVIRT